MKQNVYFVSGIDTDAGKSYATGYLAREWYKNGKRTITQKFIQTGNVGHSEDIDLHRRIMEIPFTRGSFLIPPPPIWLPDWIIVPSISTRSSMPPKY